MAANRLPVILRGERQPTSSPDPLRMGRSGGAARTGRLPVRGRTGNFEPSATPYLRCVSRHGKSQLPGAPQGWGSLERYSATQVQALLFSPRIWGRRRNGPPWCPETTQRRRNGGSLQDRLTMGIIEEYKGPRRRGAGDWWWTAGWALLRDGCRCFCRLRNALAGVLAARRCRCPRSATASRWRPTPASPATTSRPGWSSTSPRRSMCGPSPLPIPIAS